MNNPMFYKFDMNSKSKLNIVMLTLLY